MAGTATLITTQSDGSFLAVLIAYEGLAMQPEGKKYEINTAQIVSGVLDLFPGAEAGAYVLAELLEKRIAELTAERDKARRYCSVAAYDMAGFADTLKESPEAFPHTTHDLMETSEFMQLAGEGREDGTVYEDELSKEKARVAELRSALSGIEDACEILAASRSQDVYDAMARDGQSGDLIVLHEARVRARRLLNQEQD